MHSDPASRAFLEAFPYTVPIFAGFWFVAFAYGFYMHSPGFSPLYPMIIAMIIFGGSLEFVAGTMLLSPLLRCRLCSLPSLSRPAIFLRHCSHGEVQRLRLEKAFSDLYALR